LPKRAGIHGIAERGIVRGADTPEATVTRPRPFSSTELLLVEAALGGDVVARVALADLLDERGHGAAELLRSAPWVVVRPPVGAPPHRPGQRSRWTVLFLRARGPSWIGEVTVTEGKVTGLARGDPAGDLAAAFAEVADAVAARDAGG
jgi:hypothetical protein